MFILRDRAWAGDGQRQRDTESEVGSRLWAVSTGPDAGLELTDREIMTWAEVGRLTDWATQAPLTCPFLLHRGMREWSNEWSKFHFKMSFYNILEIITFQLNLQWQIIDVTLKYRYVCVCTYFCVKEFFKFLLKDKWTKMHKGLWSGGVKNTEHI